MHVLAPAATGVAPPVTTEASKTTFYLNTNKLNFTQAETACTALGGHLAAFIDKDEQVGGGCRLGGPGGQLRAVALPAWSALGVSVGCSGSVHSEEPFAA